MRSILLSGAMVLLAGALFAQSGTSSPYSIYGLGDLEAPTFAQQRAMGGASLAVPMYNSLNISNPALLPSLRSTALEVGLYSRFLTLQSPNGATQQASNTAIRNLVVGLPVVYDRGRRKKKVKRKLTFAMGLVPYSNMGYTIEDVQDDDTYGQLLYHYQGEGNINQFFLAGGYQLVTDSVQQLSIGVKGSYLFGPLEKTRRVIFPTNTNTFNSLLSNKVNLNDIYLDYGLYYRRKLKQDIEDPDKNIYASVGVSFAPSTKISGTNTILSASYVGEIGSESIRDTIQNVEIDGDAVIPLNIGIGTSVEINNAWVIALDLSTQDWSDFEFFGQQESLSRVDRLNFGMQWQPKYNAPISDYFSLIRYRGGFRYQQTRLLVQGETLPEYGINFGIGLPLVFSSSTSMFNFGVELAQRGNRNNNLIREQFTTISIGFTFTPSRFDPWFYQRKID